MQHLFLDISESNTPNLSKVFEKISSEQISRIQKKALDRKYPNDIIREIEKTLEVLALDFRLSTKVFERKYLILFNPILKPKLSISEQVEKLKRKGVRFIEMDETSAKDFLTNNTFYYKLTAYRKNFEKKDEKYKDLDFAYLVDLSVIDMHISNEALKICSCIEHALKTQLLRDFDLSPEDGYKIINEFTLHDTGLEQYPMQPERAEQLQNKSIWQIAEDITLGELFKLCDFFYKKHTRRSTNYRKIRSLSSCIIKLRNSVSHNSCLINNLNVGQLKRPTREVVDYLYLNCFDKKIKKIHIQDLLTNRFIHNFIGSLLALTYISNSRKIKYHRYKDLLLLSKRVQRNKSYYVENKTINLTFMMIIKTVIHFYKISK
ncbi:MAG: Abi family protein [Epsilonproteobacteria bacterium]|nr:Abi family protein [Campylobacterota bacterium]